MLQTRKVIPIRPIVEYRLPEDPLNNVIDYGLFLLCLLMVPLMLVVVGLQ